MIISAVLSIILLCVVADFGLKFLGVKSRLSAWIWKTLKKLIIHFSGQLLRLGIWLLKKLWQGIKHLYQKIKNRRKKRKTYLPRP